MNERRQDLETRWQERFRHYAGLFDDDARIAGWTQSGLETRYRHFTRLWSSRPGAHQRSGRWLDIGCGAGTYSRYLAARGLEVTGIDYSIESLQKAALKTGEGAIAWVNADARRLPVSDGAFAGILCFGVSQTISEPGMLVDQARAALGPGGELWIDALNSICIPNLIDVLRRSLRGEPPHLRYDNPWRLKRELSDAGFTDVRLHWIPILPGPLRRLTSLVESGPFRFLLRYVPGLGALFCHSVLIAAVRGEARRDT